jgi:hypothetical protein
MHVREFIPTRIDFESEIYYAWSKWILLLKTKRLELMERPLHASVPIFIPRHRPK